MSGTVQAVLAAIEPLGMDVVRAWPRSADHLLLDLRTAEGRRVAGQWFCDPARAAHVARRTGAAAPSVRTEVRQVGASGVVLQGGGADRRLVALASVLRRPGAVLVTHRPERRAVVRHDDPLVGTVYTKVVAPHRVPRSGPRCPDLRSVQLPHVLEIDHEAGRVTARALPGRTLHDLLGDPEVDPTRLERYGRACGVALGELHARAVRVDEPSHGLDAELAVTDRWLAAAAEHQALPARLLARLARRLGRQAAAPRPSTPRSVVLHRDLHDQQLLLHPGGPCLGAGRVRVGVLDFDLAAVGDPALDLANLLVHLDLRVLQGLTTPERAGACAAGLLAGYDPTPAVVEALPVYAELTRLRLVALYAFRPAHRDGVAALLDLPTT